MDKDEKQKSDLGNDKNLKNAERSNVTGVKTSDFRRDNDLPVTPDEGEIERAKARAAGNKKAS
jgi:hypothetical protein